GYLWKLDAPFVWGPVAGAANIPWSYFAHFGWKDRVFYSVRNLANQIQKRTKLRCRKAARRAAHIWVVGDDDRKMVSDLWQAPCEQMADSAAPVVADATVRSYDGARPLRLVWSGLHIARKA